MTRITEKHTAHLLVELETRGPIPYVRHVDITSEGVASITHTTPTTLVQLLAIERETFGDARLALLAFVRQEGSEFSWVVPFLRDDNTRLHTRRIDQVMTMFEGLIAFVFDQLCTSSVRDDLHVR